MPNQAWRMDHGPGIVPLNTVSSAPSVGGNSDVVVLLRLGKGAWAKMEEKTYAVFSPRCLEWIKVNDDTQTRQTKEPKADETVDKKNNY